MLLMLLYGCFVVTGVKGVVKIEFVANYSKGFSTLVYVLLPFQFSIGNKITLCIRLSECACVCTQWPLQWVCLDSLSFDSRTLF